MTPVCSVEFDGTAFLVKMPIGLPPQWYEAIAAAVLLSATRRGADPTLVVSKTEDIEVTATGLCDAPTPAVRHA